MKTMTAWADVSEQVRLESALLGAANGRPTQWGAVTPVPGTMRVPVHGAVQPADVRPGDPIFARVRLSSGRDVAEVPAQVWRISPLGVELVKPERLADLTSGTAVDLSLQIGNDLAHFRGLRISCLQEERGRELVAARWAEAESTAGDRACRRIGARWRCEAEYLPTGIAPCAVRYNDFFHFRVAEISKTGMQLLTSLRNKFLVPGVTFEGTCSFPTLQQVKIAFQVVQARVVKDGAKDVLALGVTWAVDGSRAAEVIGQYLLQFGPGATPEQLRNEGFRVRSTSRAFDFGCVRSEEDYGEVLALRRLAYVHAGKAGSDTAAEEMGDAFDARSRILTAKYRGRMVGSVRVMFPRTEADPLKHEEYCTLPKLPPRSEIVEASKACTHPDFRRSDLFYSLARQAGLVTLQSGRRYILLSCTDSLVRLYKKLGYKDLGVSYVHRTMGLRHHVMLGDVLSMLVGGMNPILWNVVGGPEVWEYAKRCGIVRRSAWNELRVRAFCLFKPLGALLLMRARRGRKGVR